MILPGAGLLFVPKAAREKNSDKLTEGWESACLLSAGISGVGYEGTIFSKKNVQ